MNNQIQLQQPHMQLYTLPAVKSRLLTVAPQGLLTHIHNHTHTHTGGKWERDNRRVTLRWSCLVCPFCWVKIQEGQAGQAKQRRVLLGFLYVTHLHR